MEELVLPGDLNDYDGVLKGLEAAAPAMSPEPSGGSASPNAGTASSTVEKKRNKKGGKGGKSKRKQRTVFELMNLPVDALNQDVEDLAAVWDHRDRFLTHPKVMDGAFKLIQDQTEVSEHGTYSYLMPGNKRMLFIPQDDPNGGKSKEWMARRKALFWTASKPAGSFFGVYYFHAEVARAIKAHRRYDVASNSSVGQAELVRTPAYDRIEDHAPLFKCLVSFKEFQEEFSDFSLFKMNNGTTNEDVAIEEFLKKFTHVFAAEEYLHIFNESTSQNGWSTGTSPDGLLLWYKNGRLAQKTSLEVKCGSTCTNQTCKKRRQQRAIRSEKTTEDEGFFCTDKSHFKVHNCIKTYYVGQMQLEMLGQNLRENVYVSLGYGARAAPKIKAFRMKFNRPALLACALYMRSLAELRDLAFEVKDNDVYGLGVNSPDFQDMNEDVIQRALFTEILLEHEEYDALMARVHQNFETMVRFSEHAIIGAHGWTSYSKRWRELDPSAKEVLQNAVKLDPSDYGNLGRLPPLDKVHADLASTWTDPTVRHKPVNFENPDASFLQPLSPQAFKRSYDRFLTLNAVELSERDYLTFRVPQGVLSDEFRFCLNYPNPLMMQGKIEKATWLISPTVDDAFIELRLTGGTYSTHLVRSNANAAKPAASAASGALGASAAGGDVSYTEAQKRIWQEYGVDSSEKDSSEEEEEEEEDEEELSDADKEALNVLKRLESKEGIPSTEWLVDWSPEKRSDILVRISTLMEWKRILVLPGNLDDYDGVPAISRPFVDSPKDGFDSIFVPPASYNERRPAWSFSRYVFNMSTNWSPTCMAAPPRVGGYDDEGNVDMNEHGGLDGEVPGSIDQIPIGTRVKVVVSQVWGRTCNFHTILVHKEDF